MPVTLRGYKSVFEPDVIKWCFLLPTVFLLVLMHMLGNKKILIISSEFPPDTGGIGNHAFNLARSLVSLSFDVSVVADIVHASKDDVKKFTQNCSFTFKPVIRKEPVWQTYSERIRMVISSSRDKDFIICSGRFPLWLLNVLKRIYPAKKYIAIVHGSELDLKKAWAGNLVFRSLKKASCIVAVSDYTKSFIPDDIIAKIPCRVIPNGIDIKEFVPKINDSPSPLKLITIGSVTERKGQANVVKALPAIQRLFPNAEYHIVGKPVLKDALIELASSLRVKDHIFFHGAVVREELISILQGSSVKMMLSNHTAEGDFEGFGIAILEANACGKPSIGSNFGGITNAIKNRYNGLLVDPYNVEEIAGAVKIIMGDYHTYSKQAVEWAQQHDWNIIIQRYRSILESI